MGTYCLLRLRKRVRRLRLLSTPRKNALFVAQDRHPFCSIISAAISEGNIVAASIPFDRDDLDKIFDPFYTVISPNVA